MAQMSSAPIRQNVVGETLAALGFRNASDMAVFLDELIEPVEKAGHALELFMLLHSAAVGSQLFRGTYTDTGVPGMLMLGKGRSLRDAAPLLAISQTTSHRNAILILNSDSEEWENLQRIV